MDHVPEESRLQEAWDVARIGVMDIMRKFRALHGNRDGWYLLGIAVYVLGGGILLWPRMTLRTDADMTWGNATFWALNGLCFWAWWIWLVPLIGRVLYDLTLRSDFMREANRALEEGDAMDKNDFIEKHGTYLFMSDSEQQPATCPQPLNDPKIDGSVNHVPVYVVQDAGAREGFVMVGDVKAATYRITGDSLDTADCDLEIRAIYGKDCLVTRAIRDSAPMIAHSAAMRFRAPKGTDTSAIPDDWL